MTPLDPVSQTRLFQTLRRFVRHADVPERCEMCGAPLSAGHQHLMEPASRRLLCCCDACAVLFVAPVEAKFRRVPRRIRLLTDFCLSDAQWNSLMIPINIAFFFHSTPGGRVIGYYPSPAGATESLLSLEAWKDIVQANPVLNSMEPDVEALLVNRLGQTHGYSGGEYYLLPIDECYRLVGLLRTNWRGLSGGAEVWTEIGRFFEGLKDGGSRVPSSGSAVPAPVEESDARFEF
jgi:Family of unknown function (DUF5947)